MSNQTETGDPSAVIDTFTAIEYDDTHIYLYGDRVNFCVLYKNEPLYGQSSIGPLVDASAAWVNWTQQMPEDLGDWVRSAYDAVQTVGDISRTVAETALTVDKAAEVVQGIATVTGILALITGIGSGLAAAMAAVDSFAIKTEDVAESIGAEATKVHWGLFDILHLLRDVEVRHQVTPESRDILTDAQQEAERLLDLFQQILRAAI